MVQTKLWTSDIYGMFLTRWYEANGPQSPWTCSSSSSSPGTAPTRVHCLTGRDDPFPCTVMKAILLVHDNSLRNYVMVLTFCEEIAECTEFNWILLSTVGFRVKSDTPSSQMLIQYVIGIFFSVKMAPK